MPRSFPGGQGLDGGGKGFFFLVKKTVFAKAWTQEIVTYLGNCK